MTRDPADPDDAPPSSRPRKLTLRVSGARVGSVARPVQDGATRIAPGRRLGLRVHSSALLRESPVPGGNDDEDR